MLCHDRIRRDQDRDMTEVFPAVEADEVDWERYLSARGIQHHAYSWKWGGIFSQVFGHTPKFLMAKRNSEVVGLCPLYLVQSLLFGTALISVPYLNAGGILADDEEAAETLRRAISQLGKESGVKYTELRHQQESPFLRERLPVRTHKLAMVLPMSKDPEQLFASFPPKLRSQIRRPSKAGFFAQVSGIHLSEEESARAFYKVFSEHMRDLGTPTYPKNLYSLVQKSFGERCRIITVWKEDLPVAAGLTLRSPVEPAADAGELPFGCEIPWASSLKRFQKDSPNMLLYWEAMKTACADRCGSFDFGRSSPDSGTFRFKQQWGASPVTLHWYYEIFRGEMPDVNPKNPKFEMMVRCWKKLPIPVANTLGAWLSRSIP